MDTLQKNLLNKALAGKLGHFFIVSPPGRAKNPKKDLYSWCAKIIKSYFSERSCAAQDLKNNEDVLVIDDDLLNKKFYDQAFVQTIGQFLSHRPIKSDRKFILIEDMTKMSAIHANKLLKIFEEPPVNATIFLLNPQSSKPLQTIASRAVGVRAAIAADYEPADLDKWLKKLGNKNLHQFCDYFKTRPEDEKDLARALLDRMDAESKKEHILLAQSYMQEQRVDAEYNHNTYSRLTKLREIYLDLEAASHNRSQS